MREDWEHEELVEALEHQIDVNRSQLGTVRTLQELTRETLRYRSVEIVVAVIVFISAILAVLWARASQLTTWPRVIVFSILILSAFAFIDGTLGIIQARTDGIRLRQIESEEKEAISRAEEALNDSENAA